MPEDDRIRLWHMIDAAEAVEQSMVGRQRTDLGTDRMLLFAVIRGVEVMGEAAARLSEETRSLKRRSAPYLRIATAMATMVATSMPRTT